MAVLFNFAGVIVGCKALFYRLRILYRLSHSNPLICRCICFRTPAPVQNKITALYYYFPKQFYPHLILIIARSCGII